jgi:hypothetical protein
MNRFGNDIGTFLVWLDMTSGASRDRRVLASGNPPELGGTGTTSNRLCAAAGGRSFQSGRRVSNPRPSAWENDVCRASWFAEALSSHLRSAQITSELLSSGHVSGHGLTARGLQPGPGRSVDARRSELTAGVPALQHPRIHNIDRRARCVRQDLIEHV